MQECPKCLGAKITMVPKETRGFKYENCDVCNGSGRVLDSYYQDYINANKPFDDEDTEFIDQSLD